MRRFIEGRRPTCLPLLLALFFWAPFWLSAVGRINAQFTTVINVPPDEAPVYVVGHTQVNLFAGHEVGAMFLGDSRDPNSNVELNIYGGFIGRIVESQSGTEVNVLGGRIRWTRSSSSGLANGPPPVLSISRGWVGDSIDRRLGLQMYDGVVNLFGGSIGDFFVAVASEFNVYGDRFMVDGKPIPGLEAVGDAQRLQLAEDATLTGIASDGTPFSFSAADGDLLEYSDVTLTVTTLPSIGPAVIDASRDLVPLGIRTGQTLLVGEGGSVDHNFNAGRGSTVVVTGGYVGRNLEAVDAQVTIAGGTVDAGLGVFHGSNVHIAGGQIGDRVGVYKDGRAIVSGGTLGYQFRAGDGSRVDISGGWFNDVFIAESGSEVNISGGSFGRNFESREGSEVRLYGSDFHIDGERVVSLDSIGDSLQIDLNQESRVSGVFIDGTPFSFDAARFAQSGDKWINDGTLTLVAAEPIGDRPALIHSPIDPVPLGVSEGQTLIVGEGAVVPGHFNAGWGSTVRLDGGEIGDEFEAEGAVVEISNGSVGERFVAYGGSRVHVAGGSVGSSFLAASGSEVYIAGGIVGDRFVADPGSRVTITDGRFKGVFLDSSSELQISGGSFEGVSTGRLGSVSLISGGEIETLSVGGGITTISGGSIHQVTTYSDGVLHFVGRSFLLDDVDITASLTPQNPLAIEAGDVAIDGVLADGSPFSYFFSNESYLAGQTVMVTLVPEPSALSLLVLAVAAALPLAAVGRRSSGVAWRARRRRLLKEICLRR